MSTHWLNDCACGTCTAGHPATPAPLDPSKVRVGDTVTVSGRTTAGGTYEITGEAWEPSHSHGSLWVGPVNLGATSITLTDHHSAPEPEPEWKRGDVAIITPKMWRGEVTRAIRTGDDAWATDGHGLWEDDEVLDVHELVVIDPAAVDVVELDCVMDAAESYYPEYTTEGRHAGIKALLKSLGIKAPSTDSRRG